MCNLERKKKREREEGRKEKTAALEWMAALLPRELGSTQPSLILF